MSRIQADPGLMVGFIALFLTFGSAQGTDLLNAAPDSTVLEVQPAEAIIEIPEYITIDCEDGPLGEKVTSFTITNTGGGVLQADVSCFHPAYIFEPSEVSLNGGESQVVQVRYNSTGCREGENPEGLFWDTISIGPDWGTLTCYLSNDFYYQVSSTPDTLWIHPDTPQSFSVENLACGDPGMHLSLFSDEFTASGILFTPDPVSTISVEYNPQDAGNDTTTILVGVEYSVFGGVVLDSDIVCIGINGPVPGEYHLNAEGTGDFSTIQAALDAVPVGSEIILEDGTYTGSGNWDLDFRGKDVVLRSGSNDPLLCVVDCGGTHAGAILHLGESNQCLVSGIGFVNGSEGIVIGDAVTGDGSSPTISNCRVAGFSTGIVVQEMGTSPFISGCLVEQNGTGMEYRNDTPGGRVESTVISCNTNHGIYIHGAWTVYSDDSIFFLTDCEIAGNAGTGVYSTSSFGNISLLNCSIHDNGEWGAHVSSGQDHGLRSDSCSVFRNGLGGLWGGGSYSTVVTLCEIYENIGPGIEAFPYMYFRVGDSSIRDNQGHGINYGMGRRSGTAEKTRFDQIRISGCQISGNEDNGVNLVGSLHHTVRILGCRVFENTNQGINISGPNTYRAQVFAENNTIVGNSVGAFFATDFPITLTNNIVANNEGVSVHCDSIDSLAIACSNFFGNQGGNEPTGFPDFFSITNNISVDPLFCDAANRDYHLYSNSLCALENNPDCGQIGALGVGCEGLFFSCRDLQLYDPETGESSSPLINVPVTVEGVVFSAPETYSPGGGGYLQDNTGGINFHRDDYHTPIQEGDRIRITGPLWPDWNDELYVGNFTYTILEAGLEPIPTEYTVSELLSDFHNVGSFVKVGGRVLNVTSESFWLTDEMNEVQVIRTTDTGVSFLGVSVGSYWEVQSPCFNVQGTMTLSPRRQSDITLHSLSSADENPSPMAFILHPCSPNPFNPMTTIRFDLPVDSRVHLAIYDLTGRLVTKLRSGDVETAGRQEVIWRGQDQSGRQVSTGVYLVRLKAGDFTAARQMVLVK